jgi:hypothetical protein
MRKPEVIITSTPAQPRRTEMMRRKELDRNVDGGKAPIGGKAEIQLAFGGENPRGMLREMLPQTAASGREKKPRNYRNRVGPIGRK